MKKLFSTIVVILLLSSMILIATPNATNAAVTFPDYKAMDYRTTQAGLKDMPTLSQSNPEEVDAFASTPSVGTKAYDWYLRAISRNTPTGTQPWMTLRAISGNVEVWTQDYLWFLPGDPRNADPTNLEITDAMCQFVADEFNNIIYPTDTKFFGKPADRDGTNTIFEQLAYPSYYWDWIATDNPQRVIIKILNIRDTNYNEPTYPYYTAGFFNPTYDAYYNRNMIHIDAWRFWQRLGPQGTEWIPGLFVNRPFVYDSTIAHEYQHLIHSDWNPADDLFMNEGCSMYAEYLCGFGIEPNYFNSYFYTPDNSLTVWGDQGDINILADYGVAALWTMYLSDHYGGAGTISYFVQNGIGGIDGINNALKHFGYKQRFDDVFHDWRLANLLRQKSGPYSYTNINLNDPAIISVYIHNVNGFPVPWTKGTNFGNTITILGYDTGVSEIYGYGSDYITLTNWDRPGFIGFDGDDTAFVPGWEMTADGWYSGTGIDLQDALLEGSATVSTSDPTLTLVTAYGIESFWDFGFVQVSADSGKTWTSLANAYTTSDHDPSAHPAIIANLPGLTDYNPDWPSWTTMTFDLTAYAGKTVKIGFRYMTDWATTYEGWWINSATVSGTALTLAPGPGPKASYQVTAVKRVAADGKFVYIPYDLNLNPNKWTGEYNTFAKNPTYIILVVSPTMRQGMVDYQFRVYKK